MGDSGLDLLIQRKKFDLIDEFKPSIDEGLWRGNLTGRSGSVRAFELNFDAHLYMSDQIVEGSARGRGPAKNFINEECFISGSIDGMKSELKMNFGMTFLKGVPFVLQGLIYRSVDVIVKISGLFHIRCFSGCGCGGGSGDFTFSRVQHRKANS